jgi:lysophospholipase L1-like esterase
VKPYKNFLFFSSILLLLAVITFFFGGKNYQFGEHFQVKIPESSRLPLAVEMQQPSKIYVMSEEEKAMFLAIDSSALGYPELQDLPYYPFDYADVDEHPLALFFELLQTMTNASDLIRILHYGDSQIEGDRITSAIRSYLQRSFGGSGMGAVPLFSPVNVSSYVVEKSKNWQRKFITDENPLNSLGAWMGYLQSETDGVATVKLRISPYILYPEAGFFSNINILTSNTQNAENIEVLDRSKTIHKFQNQRIGDYFSLINIPFDTAQRYCEINFENARLSHVYGISLDPAQGIVVDNLPVRGSAGYIFTRHKASLLQESFQLLNTKLVLFQFGVNTIPNDPKLTVNPKAIENALVKELTFFKALMPDVSLIVIGVSDRAYKDDEIYRTNPNVPLVRDAQRNAALRTGCVFWDLYEAMGGENSIVDWANQKPTLAGKDYTHFSARGAQRVGEMFYKSLMIEYLNYLKRRKEIALEEKLQTLNEHH